jgi:hypothetical protein
MGSGGELRPGGEREGQSPLACLRMGSARGAASRGARGAEPPRLIPHGEREGRSLSGSAMGAATSRKPSKRSMSKPSLDPPPNNAILLGTGKDTGANSEVLPADDETTKRMGRGTRRG